jgi:hypothetical protein
VLVGPFVRKLAGIILFWTEHAVSCFCLGLEAWRSLPYGEEREKGAQKQNDVPDPSKPFMQCVTKVL